MRWPRYWAAVPARFAAKWPGHLPGCERNWPQSSRGNQRSTKMNDNERQFEEFVRGINFDDKSDPVHRDGLEEKLLCVLSRCPRRKWSLQTWRILMKNRVTRLATAAVLLVA